MKTILERFLSYTRIDTTSSEETDKCPSTPNQFILANQLNEELHELGITSEVSEDCFVYGCLKANCSDPCDSVGFLAHMDTSNATSGKDIKTRVIQNYDGKDIELSEGIFTRVADFPQLQKLEGKTLIVTDGTTLLGGDDKAGIAIIMNMLQKIINLNIPHGDIYVCFTPDEEIGAGIEHIDLNRFSCDYAYTVDGGDITEISYENFNAATATLKFNGVSIHPGGAKNKMINALQLAIDFHNQLPVNERPEFTEGREGFNHLLYLNGSCEKASSAYIIRNHDKATFERQKRDFRIIAEKMNQMTDRNSVELNIRDSYFNMCELFRDRMYIVEQAAEAIREYGYTVRFDPIRGGTDGSKLSFKGILTPNLGTGGYFCHGNHELVCLEQMQTMSDICVRLVSKILEKGR